MTYAFLRRAGMGAIGRDASAAAPRVLVAVIDGMAEHRLQVGQALTSFYRVACFEDLREAVPHLRREPPLALVVDESAKPFGGRETIRRLRNMPSLKEVRIIATSGKVDSKLFSTAEELGCDAILSKPFRRSELISTISSLVNHSIEAGWKRLGLYHRHALTSALQTFNGISDLIDRGEAVEYVAVREACSPLVDAVQRNDFKAILNGVRGHDNYSYVHSMRVATFLSLFGHAMGLKGEDLLLLSSGGLLHDIGKMSIPHEVLNKPGRLTDDEFAVMRGHVDSSAAYITQCPTMPKGVGLIAAQHHEKLDGSGYPNGLKGKELNELARMAAIVDVFSALTDRRCYKPPMEPENALKIMHDEMGSHLDTQMLRLFIDLLLSSAEESAAG
ncbi:Response regulator [Paramagnetospirillum magneticum AMB-1]|uniref:Response regulator n=2 Tax=Paramagnetospirillum magneticum TaxID=84159 RepID=Q2W9L9_PARM1|nr:Response regulator [Paramagnetospirillum magneticum AMB-1]